MATFNVLVATDLHGLDEGMDRELFLRLEEACFERIPTLPYAWEIALEAPDESDAKNDAIEKFVNVCQKSCAACGSPPPPGEGTG